MYSQQNILLRKPNLLDGLSVHQLIENCPPLDPNSSYCNFLQCSHFSDTCVAAEIDSRLSGFVSGYIHPQSNDTLFIWQVAIAEEARGKGLATKMLQHILQRDNCEQVSFIETTITKDNTASWSLFKRIAESLSTSLESSEWLSEKKHFQGQHPSELLVRIGPFSVNKHRDTI